jgi:hypothetical protein
MTSRGIRLPFVWMLMWDLTFFGRRNGSFSAEETFEGSPLSCFPLLDIRLSTPCRLFDGELGGLGAGKGTSVGLFSVSSSSWKTDRLGCFSRTPDMTSGLEGSVSSTTERDLRALLSFAHMVVEREVVVVVVNSDPIKVDVRLSLIGHVIVFLARIGHVFPSH